MRKFLREQSQEFIRCPKKYLCLLGGMLINIGMRSSPMGSSNDPYYLSYMQVKANSTIARYPNTIYSSNFELVIMALTSMIAGLSKNKYTLSYMQMYYAGLALYVLVIVA